MDKKLTIKQYFSLLRKDTPKFIALIAYFRNHIPLKYLDWDKLGKRKNRDG